MATNVTFNGSIYSVPAEGDSNWGTALSNYFIAIASGALQKTGGTFTLTAETDFGGSFGLKALYVKSRATNPASAGIFRLGNNENISWRNAANNANLSLSVDTDDTLNFNGSSISIGGDPVQTEITVSDTATINMTLAAADVSAIVVEGSLGNAHIAADAAIALSKLATVTASRALVSDGSGVISASSVTATELGLLSGRTGTLATLAETQTLTNKTIVVANNTVTTAASGNLVATELNTALAELQGNIDTLDSDLDAHISDASGAHAASAISYTPTAPLTATNVQAALDEIAGGAAGGGGAGGSMQWIPGRESPIETIENGLRVHLFEADANQSLQTTYNVPATYVAGDQLVMRMLSYSPDSSGTNLLYVRTTLLRPGSSAADSTTNQHLSDNTAITLSVADQIEENLMDLCDSSGEINSVALQAGDLIKIELLRDNSDTGASDIRALVYTAGVSVA